MDLVAGCPPCQGFSKLTDKYHKDDPRNELVSEMARVVLEISPRAVMMENVPGLAIRGKDKLDEFTQKLEAAGYQGTFGVLKLANYGVPQSRRRLLYLAGKGFKIELPPETHSRKGDKKKNLKEWLCLADVIKGLDKPTTLSKALRQGGPRRVNWNVVRDLKKISKDRMKALRTGGSRKSLPNRLRPKCHKNTYRGFENVYGRMAWKQLPSTVTTGFASPSTGRFGHPSQIRTISVREAALLQTFPPDYKFETDFVERVTDLVGNALPPRFAELAGRRCMRALEESFKERRVTRAWRRQHGGKDCIARGCSRAGDDSRPVCLGGCAEERRHLSPSRFAFGYLT